MKRKTLFSGLAMLFILFSTVQTAQASRCTGLVWRKGVNLRGFSRLVRINGYCDHVHSEQSNLSFSGIDEHMRVMTYGLKRIGDNVLDAKAYTTRMPMQVTALACLFNSKYVS